MSDLKKVPCFLIALTVVAWMASSRLIADDSLPPSDFADARDTDAPDPQFADGSPAEIAPLLEH